ncbi:MAG: ATP-dependent sacrificial sulfur transferase LarE [Eubacterium sp.]|nr:ATP-dependent sacrificial sulfur transferase LarE [Eubacterium sp.]
MENRILLDKYDILKRTLTSYQSVAVAFSGGVDSSFLLYTASKTLGNKTLAITAKSRVMPGTEMTEATEFCKKLGVRQMIIEPDVLSIPGFSDNPPDRCYICKKNLFSRMKDIAMDTGMRVLIEGSNVDDRGDFRPGLRALEELKIHSPLVELGFTKKEIRALSHALDLPTWDKPSYACLATRIPYGETIDASKLEMVEKAEQYLRDLGFREVRVRVHGTVSARIELNPNDFSRFMRGDVRLEVNLMLKRMGFAYVSLDLQGYRTGSMNEVLPESL